MRTDYFDVENAAPKQSRRYPEYTAIRSRGESEPHVAGLISEAYSIASESHRTENQDAWMLSTTAICAGVFDGVSSAYNPARASESSAQYMKDLFEALPTEAYVDDSEVMLRDAFQLTHDALGGGKMAWHEDTTTGVVARLMTEPHTNIPYVSIASVGDSRAYRFRDGKLEPLTFDDHGDWELERYKLLQAKLDEVTSADDYADDEELKFAYKRRNVILSAIGDSERQDLRAAVRVSHHPVQPGDLFLLTSDGIHDNLTRTEIERFAGMYATQAEPETLTHALVTYAQAISRRGDYVRSKFDDMTAVSLYFV